MAMEICGFMPLCLFCYYRRDWDVALTGLNEKNVSLCFTRVYMELFVTNRGVTVEVLVVCCLYIITRLMNL